ncbi:hypothetical protein CRG98_046865 [Punica granatum]|uniref:Uncharacterized protein n=1 Tax=Punica granatum TaxID=22663 RepID=A0A2I0HM28_PUNGR|nr:hypothetical protein CRG98_046865 [Punica granatum]
MGACPESCLVHGRLPRGLQYAWGAYRMNLHNSQAPTQWTCRVHEHLLDGFARCTGACPAGCKVRCFPKKVHAN